MRRAPRVPLALVVAVAENGVIGADGGLPWRIRADLRRFRAITMGKPLVMGRATYESIGRALDGRDSIVLTKRRDFAPAGVLVAHDLDDALALAAERAEAREADEISVIGGGELFSQTMDAAVRLHVSHVQASPAGDVTFPAIDPAQWVEVSREDLAPSEGDTARAVYAIYERRG
jgi:dihydrofolate reductase